MKNANITPEQHSPIYRIRLRIALAFYSGATIRSRIAYAIDPRKAHYRMTR